MKYFVIIIALVAAQPVIGQINLVPNPSFEQFTQCPTDENQMQYVVDWQNFEGTPDYFNACSSSGFCNVPYSLGIYNFQYARTGGAYVGFFPYWTRAYVAPYPWIREFIGVQLKQPLQAEETYYFEMYVSLASWNPFPCSSNHIGVKFTTQSYAAYANTFTSPLVTNSATIFVDTMITDTANWVKVSATFMADSAYQYLVIGNFFDNEHTDTAIMGASPYCFSYYFVDDVCVSSDSSGCLVSNVNEIEETDIVSVTPNPFNEYCNINIEGWETNEEKVALSLADEFSRIRKVNYQLQVQSNIISLTIYKGNLEKGMYFLTITAGSKQAVVHLIVQ